MLFMSVNATAYDTSLADKSGATALTDEYGTETDFSRVFHVIRDSLGEYLKTVTKSVLLLLSVVILSSVFSSYCGGDSALLTEQRMPEVLGVAVVCPGISAETEYRVMSLVSALFDVPTNRISISK